MINIKLKIISIFVGIPIFISNVSAYVFNTTTWGGGIATQNITSLNQLLWENLTTYIGGNITSASPATFAPNFGMVMYDMFSAYVIAVGQPVWVIFFALPFIAMWIVQANMTLPAIIGMLFSLLVFVKIGNTYAMFAVGCFIIALTALLYSLYNQ